MEQLLIYFTNLLKIMDKEDLENILFWWLGWIFAFFWIGYWLNPIELIQTWYSKIVSYITSEKEVNDNLSVEEAQNLLKDKLDIGYDKEYLWKMRETIEELAQKYYKKNPERMINLSDEERDILDSARQLYVKNQLWKAFEKIQYLESKYPTQPNILITSSAIYCGLWKYNEWINKLESIIDYPIANKWLANCYFRKKDYWKAWFYVYRALEIMPEDITMQIMRDKIINY